MVSLLVFAGRAHRGRPMATGKAGAKTGGAPGTGRRESKDGERAVSCFARKASAGEETDREPLCRTASLPGQARYEDGSWAAVSDKGMRGRKVTP
ncbi:MAG: hypothetical protein CMM40_22500 [Rhodospirillaceae bacterium]|nr:hypothetical protein [Rhodospirillaceae bacterium]MAX65164.1 hypothetical protein [Rhodospirillaceae bacterium]MBB59495.1 hypothetical protein [Rhodospirillaceae bacterium]|tara:strand:+ start:4739 stop:5023 length:285 start_codon:yes stop_codon:yes gene_type:complete